MPRQARVEYAGAIYHVTMRMVGGAWETGQELDPSACLFQCDAERERFLAQLAERVDEYGIRLFAYCLMLSHLHLYLETPQGNLSRFMHSLATAYTVYVNLRRQRHGSVLGRYKAKLVEGDNYHMTLSRYLHLNPIRVASVAKLSPEDRLGRLRDYSWSSYHDYIGKRKAPGWLNAAPVLALCADRPSDQRRAYVRFVEEAVVYPDEETGSLVHGKALGIGDAEFQDQVREQMIESAKSYRNEADVSMRHEADVLAADDVFAAVAECFGVEERAFLERRRNSVLRGVAARMLSAYAGLTQREIAKRLGIGTGAAVSQHLRRLQVRLAEDARLRRQVERLDERLREGCCG